MRGQVVQVNKQRGMVAVLTVQGDHSILELIGDDVEIGDELLWDGSYPLGGEDVRNLTHNSTMSVFFQNHCVPHSQLRQQLLY